MQVWVVRNIKTQKLLGFFWASSPESLWWVLDDLAMPTDYEWLEIRDDGGLYYPYLERLEEESYSPVTDPLGRPATPIHLTDAQRLGTLAFKAMDKTDSVHTALLTQSGWKRFDTEGILESPSVKQELARRAAL